MYAIRSYYASRDIAPSPVIGWCPATTVSAIGGLKEKLLAAHRGEIKTVLIPEENVKDLAEIPENIKNRLEIVPVKWIDKA